MALIFELQGWIPSLEMIIPKYCTEGCRKWHLFILIVRPFSLKLFSTSSNLWRCSSLFFPVMSTSSIYVTDYTWLFRKDLFHHTLENSWWWWNTIWQSVESIQACLNSYKHSFFPSAIKIWNSLPQHVIDLTDIEEFKHSLAGLETI